MSKTQTKCPVVSISSAKKKNDDSMVWDEIDLDPMLIPEELIPTIQVASGICAISYKDAKNSVHSIERMEAVDWLFYSKDKDAWSFGYVLDVMRHFIPGVGSTAQARINMLKDPDLLRSKEDYDQRMFSMARPSARSWTPLSQEVLKFGT